MIYDSTITNVNESEIMQLLENVEDRFENETMAEATAIIVGEQEANWTKFMKAVGLSELASIMEGEEVIYEGARLDKLVSKAKGFFEWILTKLAELTKSFMAKVDQIIKTNAGFVKKYATVLRSDVDYSKINVSFEGYTFKHYDNPPAYDKGLKAASSVDVASSGSASAIVRNKDSYTTEKAQNSFFGTESVGDGTFTEKINKWYYGEGKHSIKVDKEYIDDQLKIIEKTKELKKEAKESYQKASKEVKDIIKELKKAKGKVELGSGEGKVDVEKSTTVSSAFNLLLGYWKSFASACSVIHGAHLTMLGKRNKQARAACTKVLTASGKAKKSDEKDVKTEGFVDTNDFLGAVEFI